MLDWSKKTGEGCLLPCARSESCGSLKQKPNGLLPKGLQEVSHYSQISHCYANARCSKCLTVMLKKLWNTILHN